MSERVQVAVVGAGPAGLAATASAAEAGAATLLIDEQPEPGGQLRYRPRLVASMDGVRSGGRELARELTARALAAGVRLQPASTVWGVFTGSRLGVRAPHGVFMVDPGRIVLATGSVDRAAVFPGGSLPGVFTARAVQLLINVHGVLPGERFAIVGAAAEADEVAAGIVDAGGTVVATAPDAGAVLAGGASGIEWIEIGGRRAGVDVIVTALGRQADFALAQMAGCRLGFSEAAGRYVPALSERLETSVSGIYLAGDAAGPASVDAALAEGTLAGLEAARSLGLPVDEDALSAAIARHVAVVPGRLARNAGIPASFDQVDRVGMGLER